MSAECFKQLSIYFFFQRFTALCLSRLFFFFPNCCHGRNFSLPLWHNTEIQLCEGYKPSEGLRTEMWGCLLALGASEEWCSCAPGWWWFLGGGRGAAPLLLCLHWLLAQLIVHPSDRQKWSLTAGHFSWLPLCGYSQSTGHSEAPSLSLCSSLRKGRQFFSLSFFSLPLWLPGSMHSFAGSVLLGSSSRD